MTDNPTALEVETVAKVLQRICPYYTTLETWTSEAEEIISALAALKAGEDTGGGSDRREAVATTRDIIVEACCKARNTFPGLPY